MPELACPQDGQPFTPCHLPATRDPALRVVRKSVRGERVVFRLIFGDHNGLFRKFDELHNCRTSQCSERSPVRVFSVVEVSGGRASLTWLFGMQLNGRCLLVVLLILASRSACSRTDIITAFCNTDFEPDGAANVPSGVVDWSVLLIDYFLRLRISSARRWPQCSVEQADSRSRLWFPSPNLLRY